MNNLSKKATRYLSVFVLPTLLLSAMTANANGWQRLTPVTDGDYYDRGVPSPAKVELGRMLFFDKVISGNKNVSCATCHHPLTATADGLSLSLGEGARGLGITRAPGDSVNGVHRRVPRNAPALFNLGAFEFDTMFHDGRVQVNLGSSTGFDSPVGESLPLGLENVLAVQAMFPVTSPEEMSGNAGENDIADAAAVSDLVGPNGVWALLAQRLQRIPRYVELFESAFPEISSPSDIKFVHAANAIAAFEASAWRSDNSQFDRFLRGENSAMSGQAARGMRLFYGRADCSRCHSGVFQTDHSFHAIAMPQIGPGKGDGDDGFEDFGRERVTHFSQDRYRFRTPSLRNVMLTGPWGHAGAYGTIREVIMHHTNPVRSLNEYDHLSAVLPARSDLDSVDFVVMSDELRRNQIAQANELSASSLSERDIQDLLAFLDALTDHSSIKPHIDVPRQVPSGLDVFD